MSEPNVFITGAAAGIGRETSLLFARNGYRVGAFDIDDAGLASVKAEIDGFGGSVVTGVLDVTDPEPASPDSPLFQMDNVIVTPHYAPTTLEAAMRVSTIAAENIVSYLSGREPVGRLI